MLRKQVPLKTDYEARVVQRITKPNIAGELRRELVGLFLSSLVHRVRRWWRK